MLHQAIIIVGGGPVGLSLALMLNRQGKRVTVIDAGLDKSSDGRVLALSHASCQILAELGAWNPSTKSVTAINTVQISHAGLGISQIKAEQLDLATLGYTINYAEVCQQLLTQVLSCPDINLITAQVNKVAHNSSYALVEYSRDGENHLLTCDLLVMAEGGKLLADVDKKIAHDYRQQALISHVKTKQAHRNVAYERFAGRGPLVLLPYQDHYVAVWSLPTELAEEFISHPDHLIDALNEDFTARLGGATLLQAPISFPLRLIQTKQRVDKRMVLVGNSAQIVHPVSAQGLNLGLRDACVLSELLAVKTEIVPEDLHQYDELRNRDANAVIGFTHFLATKLEKRSFLHDHLRGCGLIGLSNLPILQNMIARSLIFGV